MEILLTLQALLPVLGEMTGHAEIATLVSRLATIAESEVARRQAATGQTREQILEDASKTWAEAVRGADELAALGHEEIPSGTEVE